MGLDDMFFSVSGFLESFEGYATGTVVLVANTTGIALASGERSFLVLLPTQTGGGDRGGRLLLSPDQGTPYDTTGLISSIPITNF